MRQRLWIGNLPQGKAGRCHRLQPSTPYGEHFLCHAESSWNSLRTILRSGQMSAWMNQYERPSHSIQRNAPCDAHLFRFSVRPCGTTAAQHHPDCGRPQVGIGAMAAEGSHHSDAGESGDGHDGQAQAQQVRPQIPRRFTSPIDGFPGWDAPCGMIYLQCCTGEAAFDFEECN